MNMDDEVPVSVEQFRHRRRWCPQAPDADNADPRLKLPRGRALLIDDAEIHGVQRLAEYPARPWKRAGHGHSVP